MHRSEERENTGVAFVQEDNNVDHFSGKDSWRPKVGEIFESLDEVEFNIKAWARSVGFELRRGHSKQGLVVFECNHAMKLNPEMIAKIEHYAKADLGLCTINTLPRNEYPEHYF